MSNRRKLKKGPIIFIIVLIVLLVLTICGFKLYKHYTSYEYKLGKVGYSDDEISTLLKSNKQVIDKALKGYDEDLIGLVSRRYFLWKNYKVYKEYINQLHKKTNDIDYDDVVVKVNTKRNYDLYTHTLDTNIDKGNSMLVNKYYQLSESYVPDDLVNVSNQHAYGTVQIRKEVYDAFKKMFDAAKKDNVTLIINSGYRDYASQEKIYNQYKHLKGEEYADKYAARPGHSEHQTGLALDIITYNTKGEDFDKTEAFKWLSKNAYKYGFVLRYSKEKEEITGYSYESWHYRYLGIDLATKVYKSGLSYDEYYAFYEEE